MPKRDTWYVEMRRNGKFHGRYAGTHTDYIGTAYFIHNMGKPEESEGRMMPAQTAKNIASILMVIRDALAIRSGITFHAVDSVPKPHRDKSDTFVSCLVAG